MVKVAKSKCEWLEEYPVCQSVDKELPKATCKPLPNLENGSWRCYGSWVQSAGSNPTEAVDLSTCYAQCDEDVTMTTHIAAAQFTCHCNGDDCKWKRSTQAAKFQPQLLSESYDETLFSTKIVWPTCKNVPESEAVTQFDRSVNTKVAIPVDEEWNDELSDPTSNASKALLQKLKTSMASEWEAFWDKLTKTGEEMKAVFQILGVVFKKVESDSGRSKRSGDAKVIAITNVAFYPLGTFKLDKKKLKKELKQIDTAPIVDGLNSGDHNF